MCTVLTSLMAICGCDNRASNPATTRVDNSDESSMRIVSMAPSLTEILFKLNLGDKVVGVTNFCDYPPAAQDKAKIGGFYDVNYEKITTLKPTLVLLLKEHEDARRKYDALGIDYLRVDNRTLDNILGSVIDIGRRCGADKEAQALLASLQERIDSVRKRIADSKSRPRTMICIGRTMGSGQIQNVYLAGPNTIYDEILNLAGGRNAYDKKLEYPTVSAEGIIRMNPEVVIELAADLEAKKLSRGDIRQEWQKLPQIDAVKNNRIHIFTGDYVTVPGPRIVKLLEDFADALHPVDRTHTKP